MTFTPDVYEQIRAGARRSAAAIVPLVTDLFDTRTVIDVGCGEGWFAREFAKHGCTVLALDESVTGDRVEWIDSFDGPPDADGHGRVTFQHADLTGDAWRPDTAADLAVCLEVAEHLPESAADGLIISLCALAPVVLFSAAIPGQGGHGHVNEQWPGYWVRRFEQCGFEVSGDLRWHVWGNESVEPWYQQNLLVAVHRDRLLSDVARNHGYNELFGPHAFDEPIPVVHPTTFEYWVEIAKARRGA